jgi:ATP-dependent DNA ligase
VTLPVQPPVAPMLSRLVREIPAAGDVIYEPKWDGFRAIVFRDGASVELGSRNERPMTRYFPELLQPLCTSLPERCVVDGEIVIAGPKGLDFDALLQRIHPAASRVRKLAEETPASFVAFDLLAEGDEDLRTRPFEERRRRLERALAQARPPVHLTPATRDRATAEEWFRRFEGAGLDGVMVKPVALPYLEDKREMFKVKHERTADCVVAGFRSFKGGEGVGSLLLGLYDGQGTLHHVGICSGFTAALRKQLVGELEPLRADALANHPWREWASLAGEGEQRMPGAPSRWNNKKDLSWEAVRPERVVEVGYDHLQGSRFRHATHFLRWRPDRTPESCTYDQLESVVPAELQSLFAGDWNRPASELSEQK